MNFDFCSGFVYYNLMVFGPKHEFVCLLCLLFCMCFFLAHMCTYQPYILVLYASNSLELPFCAQSTVAKEG